MTPTAALKRSFSTLIHANGKPSGKFHRDFNILPDVFTLSEQRILLAAALETLDSVESRPFRKRRNALRNETDMKTSGQSQTLLGLFLPDEYYQMEEAGFFINFLQ